MRRSHSIVLGLVVGLLGACAQGKRGDDVLRADLLVGQPPAPADLSAPPDLTIQDLLPALLAAGASCDGAAECASGYCVDRVCCDKACDGACESCILSGTVGLCQPVPNGDDPDQECRGMAVLTVDGGLGDGGDFSSVDGGSFVNLGACAGACNGKRACAFPGATQACGVPYCSESNEAATFGCDGKGGCAVDKQACLGTYCSDGACPTQCDEPADCAPGWYCNGATSQCAKVKANGLLCELAYECQTGFCEGGVCCNEACGAPGSCAEAGHEGECRCGGKSCGAGVACQLVYRDLDEDTYGDQFGTFEDFTAKAICVGDALPTGFVADHTDCDDFDQLANPAQTDYFDKPTLGRGIFDYDCNGTLSKLTREHASSSCVFCAGSADACMASSTCASSGTGAVMTCEAGLTFCSCGSFLCLCSRCGAGLFTTPGAGFVGAVACGDMGHYRECGSCTTNGGGVVGTTDDYTKIQKCR